MYVCMYLSIYLSLSLSLYIYIFIFPFSWPVITQCFQTAEGEGAPKVWLFGMLPEGAMLHRVV